MKAAYGTGALMFVALLERVYNGGRGDWGNNLTLPVIERDKPYDQDFDL